MVAQAARNHSPDDGIQHLIGNVLVDLEEDQANVRANLVVTFARHDAGSDAPSAQGQVYLFEARHYPSGWRLARVETRPVWVSHAIVTR